MASTLTVTNRCMQSPSLNIHCSYANYCLPAAKKPIKKLPKSISITDTTTVQDVKDSLAKQAGGMDPNRLGLFDSKNKILKDRKALISQHKEVTDNQEVFVKDLGRWAIVYHQANADMHQVRRFHGSRSSLSNMPAQSLSTYPSSSSDHTSTAPLLLSHCPNSCQWQ